MAGCVFRNVALRGPLCQSCLLIRWHVAESFDHVCRSTMWACLLSVLLPLLLARFYAAQIVIVKLRINLQAFCLHSPLQNTPLCLVKCKLCASDIVFSVVMHISVVD